MIAILTPCFKLRTSEDYLLWRQGQLLIMINESFFIRKINNCWNKQVGINYLKES